MIMTESTICTEHQRHAEFKRACGEAMGAARDHCLALRALGICFAGDRTQGNAGGRCQPQHAARRRHKAALK